MTNVEFNNLVDEFFNFPRTNKSYTYTPTKMAVDVVDDKLEIAYLVVGHDPKNVEVNLTESQINIRATKDREDSSVANQFVYDIDETLNLSKDYDGLTAQAEIRNGIITITVEKKEAEKPKKLSIKF